MIAPNHRGSLLHAVAVCLACCAMAQATLPPSARAQLPTPAESVPFTDDVRDGRQFRAFDLTGAGDRAILNYSSFDIAANQGVQFIQSSAQAQVLNRIASAVPSQIDGQIHANGEVFILNPAGVIFGQSAVVDVAGLFAAAGTLSDQDFLAGTLRFVNLTGPIENRGLLRAAGPAARAIVSLLGANVANSGQIVAPGGAVVAVAGNDVLLTRTGSNVVVRLSGAAAGLDPAVPGIANSGSITADGGSVQLAVGDMYATAFLQSETGSIGAQDIALNSTDDGGVDVGGTLQAASASSAPSTVSITSGGDVSLNQIRADQVSVSAASILDGSTAESPLDDNVTAGTATLTATRGPIGRPAEADLDILAQDFVRLLAEGVAGSIAAHVNVPPSPGAIEASATGDVAISTRVSLPITRVSGDFVTLRAGTSIFEGPEAPAGPNVTARSGAALLAAHIGARNPVVPANNRGFDVDIDGPLTTQATGVVNLRSAGNLVLSNLSGGDITIASGTDLSVGLVTGIDQVRLQARSILQGSSPSIFPPGVDAPLVALVAQRIGTQQKPLSVRARARLDATAQGPQGFLNLQGSSFDNFNLPLGLVQSSGDARLNAAIIQDATQDEAPNLIVGGRLDLTGNAIGFGDDLDVIVRGNLTATGGFLDSVNLDSPETLNVERVSTFFVELRAASLLDATPDDSGTNVSASVATLTATEGAIGGPGDADLDIGSEDGVRLTANGPRGSISAFVGVSPTIGIVEASATGDVSLEGGFLPLRRVQGDFVTLRARASIFDDPQEDPVEAPNVTARSGARLIGENVGVRDPAFRGADLDLAVTGALTVESTGVVALDSASDLSLARVQGTDVSIRATQIRDGTAAEASNLVATTARLQATTGDIGGTGNADLDVQVSGPLTASAPGRIVLSSTGDLRAAQVSGSQVTLSARSILDGSAADELANVTGQSLSLTATAGSIGAAGAADLDVQADTLAARATGNVVISSQGALSLDQVSATNVTLQARSILDAQPGAGLEVPNVLALTANLTATGGNIGGPGNADLDVLALVIRPSATGSIFLDPILGFVQRQPGPVTLGALQRAVR
jgi:filamentous hemagglutinin family protein